MHSCGYGRIQASSIALPIAILPPEPSPPGVMHHHHHHHNTHGSPLWLAGSSSASSPHCSQPGSQIATTTITAPSLRVRPISSRPPRKRPRLARWNAAPYLPRRSLEAMATGQGASPRYGDDASADVILIIKPIEGGPLPPLLVNSQALKRSEFFETRLSERWAREQQFNAPFEIVLDKCGNPSNYIRCVQLLYVPDRIKHTAFHDVQDALRILEVAAELLFHDCVDACMKYLEAVPWTVENEGAIRACVGKLHLRLAPDLAARLVSGCSGVGGEEDHGSGVGREVGVMKNVLGELLGLVTNGAPSKARDITERVLLANVHPSTSVVFARVNESSLLKEFQGNLSQLKVQLRKFSNFFSWNALQVTLACSALRWLLDELFALQIADTPIKLFSEEKELAQLMVSQNPFTETLFHILVRMLQSLQKGEVVAPRVVRLGLVSMWLPVVAKLGNDGYSDDRTNSCGKNDGEEVQRRSLEVGLGAVVETLPVLDQEVVFKIWIGSCLKCRRVWPDLSESFDSWCGKLRAAQRDSASMVEVGNLQLNSVPSTSEVCSS